MTRLTEALERAQRIPKREPEETTAAAARLLGHDRPAEQAWAFDVDEQRRSPAGPVPPAALATPAPEPSVPVAAAYNFPDQIVDKLIVGKGADHTLVEQYRRLAAVLHHAQLQRGAKSVMIASALASEGKTLTATNLALTISHSYQRRVLLIDADLRRPSVHDMFRLPNDIGLGNSLLALDEGGRLPVRSISPTLWVLTAGRPNSDPMSALVSDTMKQLLADAADQFDWVVIDTPPVALMPDANLLAGMIDTALLVVSANTTPYPLSKRAADAIGTSRILGVVFNRADRAVVADAYGYGYYSYYYGHKSRDQKRSLFGLFGAKRT